MKKVLLGLVIVIGFFMLGWKTNKLWVAYQLDVDSIGRVQERLDVGKIATPGNESGGEIDLLETVAGAKVGSLNVNSNTLQEVQWISGGNLEHVSAGGGYTWAQRDPWLFWSGTTTPTADGTTNQWQFNTKVSLDGGLYFPTGASNGYVLTSDASGNASWAAASSGSTNIYNSDGTLSANRTLSGAGKQLFIGSATSECSTIDLLATSGIQLGNGQSGGIIFLDQGLEYATDAAADANFALTHSSNKFFLPTITGNRNLTWPASYATGEEWDVLVTNTSASFHWSISGVTVKNLAGTAVVTLTNGTAYRFIYDGTTIWSY